MDLLNKEQRTEIPFIGKLGKLSKNNFEKILNNIENVNLDKKDCWIWAGHIVDKIRKGHQHGSLTYNKKVFKFIELCITIL